MTTTSEEMKKENKHAARWYCWHIPKQTDGDYQRRLVSALFDADVNDLGHICMLHCLSVMSGQCGSTALK